MSWNNRDTKLNQNKTNILEELSSSDTYTEEKEKMDSFDRNFGGEDVHRTIQLKIDDDEFLFTGPVPAGTETSVSGPKGTMVDTITDLEDPVTGTTANTDSTNVNDLKSMGSPTKSIMKKTPNSSPRKNVVFTQNNPQVIHFHDQLEDSHDDFTDKIEQTLNHQWNLVDDEPPVPPPHTVITPKDFTDSLHQNNLDNENDENFKKLNKNETLHRFKLNQEKITLNEKLGLFLDSNSRDDLDQHLSQLDTSTHLQTNENIQNLSLNLQDYHSNVENPLNSLSKSNEVPLRSAGSSQSSLQSLLDNNRSLEMNNLHKGNKGLELNDGIHGFSNDLVEQLANEELVKQPEDAKVSDDSGMLVMSKSANRLSMVTVGTMGSFSDEYHDSFDDYNTEQSIMNLLDSAAPTGSSEPLGAPQSETVPSVAPVPAENSAPVETKSVPNHMTSHLISHLTDPVIKSEIKQEFSPFIEIKSEHVKTEIEKPILQTPIIDTDAETDAEADVETDASEEAAHLNIRDNVDEDWKLEYSEDGDKEDNDIYTYNDVTMISQTEAGPDFLKKELEVNFSPNSSQEIMESPRSLAPPRSPEKEAPRSLVASPLAPALVALAPLAETSPAEKSKLPTTTVRQEQEQLQLQGSPIRKSFVPKNLKASTPTTSVSSVSVKVKSEPLEEEPLEPREIEEPEPEVDEVPLDTEPVDTVPVNTVEAVETNSDVPEVPSLEPAEAPAGSSDPANDTVIHKPMDKEERDDKEFLANSTNVAPDDTFPEVTLPPIEPTNYSSFEEITRNLNQSDDFEQSLSAEFDEEKPSKPTNFLSIWHSQSKPHVPKKSFNTSNISIYDPSAQEKLPAVVKDKKFKEVNVMSRRVVSPHDVDLNVTDFLPELSQDSGFEGQFKHVIDYANVSGSRLSKTPLSEKNILNDVEDLEPVPEPEPEKSLDIEYLKPKSYPKTLKPSLPSQPMERKKSKFKVPSFEIKRSDSKLNTRDKYNDIFDESAINHSMTIKGSGMKTLPSMDKEDVQKILSTKRIISQEEYSQLKLVGKSVGSVDKFDSASQKASIYDINSSHDEDMMHIANELMKNPMALASKDQVFNDSDLFTNGSRAESRAVSHVTPEESDDDLPNPDPEILHRGIFKTPPKDKKSPIKITSPIKLVKKGSTVTSVVLENNHTIRKPKGYGPLVQDEDKENRLESVHLPTKSLEKPVVVSVPSVYSNVTEPSTASSKTLLNHSKNPSWKQHSIQDSVIRENTGSMERGRLFFRVVGLKNINLPDIEGHNGEFSVTLDNGVHCIKTPNYKFDSSKVVIGKEFELMVGESLEFILTMKMTYEKPKGKLVEVKERKVVKSKSRISRMFGSKDIITTTKFVASDPVDPWDSKFAPDGSFARCYIDLAQYELKINFTANSFDIPCFNEWETIITKSGNIKAKPYVIGNLEVKMLYIPRTELHESLPSSIKSAYDVIDQIEEEKNYQFEGYMNQDGGDCESWKRRYFKLKGTSLIAYSEVNHKTRAKINLSKVVDVIYVDSKSTDTKKTRDFSDVLLVPESFKIKFANGELIDFGAPSMKEKFQWIEYFNKISQHNRYRKLPWVKKMLEDSEIKSNNPFYNKQTREFS